MNDRLCYSLSSNWLVRSEMFDRKKHLTELQLMNRFRKMHLYDAIHSLSGKKLHKNSKTNNTQFLQPQSSSSKNITQSKPHKKNAYPFNSILIQQRDDHHQNKLIKLKHFTTQKSQTQTLNKLPNDYSKQAINKLLDEKYISGRKRELIVRAEKVMTNNDRNHQQERLSIKLCSKSGANEYNSTLQQRTTIDYDTNISKQTKQRIKKWQTSHRQQPIISDFNRVRLSNIDSYQTHKQRQQQDDEQQYEIGRWSSHYNQDSQQQQLRQTQLSQVDEQELMQRDKRINVISSSDSYKNACYNDNGMSSNDNNNTSVINQLRMSLVHYQHQHQDYATQGKKKGYQAYLHTKKQQHQQQQQNHLHHNNNNHKNVKFIADNITCTSKYSITNFNSNPHLLTADTDHTNIVKNSNTKYGSILKKNISLQKLRPLTGETKDNYKEKIILLDTPKHSTLIIDETDKSDNLRESKKSEKHHKREYIHKFIKSKSNKRLQGNSEINKKAEKVKQSDSDDKIGGLCNGKEGKYFLQNEESNNIELLHPDRESSTRFEDKFTP